ncbi:hypothetical protein EDD18DRAFT_1103385 [Armillaria luteobubalina]|uniref:Uncharacterized protein n=1 Tax=Armillaria luteobubalina TaxID=153913 RepID=A0AA39Q9T4_9AGAR|nr:hypothetical protein EDD18DRAFT_1103385 [Armillaria luteobubalina]
MAVMDPRLMETNQLLLKNEITTQILETYLRVTLGRGCLDATRREALLFNLDDTLHNSQDVVTQVKAEEHVLETHGRTGRDPQRNYICITRESNLRRVDKRIYKTDCVIARPSSWFFTLVGSVTRTLSPGVRTIPPPERASLKDMLLAAEEALKDLPGYRSVFAEDWVPDMDSHVILAACMGNEVAKAKRVRKMGTEVWEGVFTSLLVKTLRSGVLGREATYADLIEALPPLHFQTPNVAGGHKDTRLWYQV